MSIAISRSRDLDLDRRRSSSSSIVVTPYIPIPLIRIRTRTLRHTPHVRRDAPTARGSDNADRATPACACAYSAPRNAHHDDDDDDANRPTDRPTDRPTRIGRWISRARARDYRYSTTRVATVERTQRTRALSFARSVRPWYIYTRTRTKHAR